MDIDGLAHPAAAIPDKDHSATANSDSILLMDESEVCERDVHTNVHRDPRHAVVK